MLKIVDFLTRMRAISRKLLSISLSPSLTPDGRGPHHLLVNPKPLHSELTKLCH